MQGYHVQRFSTYILYVVFSLVTTLTAVPKGIVWKVLHDATGLVKLDLVKIDDHFNQAVMPMLIACLAHHLFLSWQFPFPSTDTLHGCSQSTSSLKDTDQSTRFWSE